MSSQLRFPRFVACLVSLCVAFGLMAGLEALTHLPMAHAVGITVNTTADEYGTGADWKTKHPSQKSRIEKGVVGRLGNRLRQCRAPGAGNFNAK